MAYYMYLSIVQCDLHIRWGVHGINKDNTFSAENSGKYYVHINATIHSCFACHIVSGFTLCKSSKFK